MYKINFPWLSLASLAATISGCIPTQPLAAQSTCQGVQFGAFGKSVIFSIALQEGFFTNEGVNLCYNAVTGSVQQFDTLVSGGYDVISTASDNVVNRRDTRRYIDRDAARSDQGRAVLPRSCQPG